MAESVLKHLGQNSCFCNEFVGLFFVSFTVSLLTVLSVPYFSD